MNQAKPNRIRYGEVAGRIEQQMDQSDQLRTDSLKNLHRVRDAKRSTLNREQARLSSKLGDKHPRTRRMSERVARNDHLVRDLSLAVGRAESQIVEIEENSWVLHGRVLSEDLVGLYGLSVQLQDAGDRVVIRSKRTDKSGYFKLVQSVEDDAEGVSGRKEDRKDEYFIIVADRDGSPLHTERLDVIPGPGNAQYTEIVIPDDTNAGPRGEQEKPARKKAKKKTAKKRAAKGRRAPDRG